MSELFDPMKGLGSLVQENVSVSQRKRQELARASQEKKNQFNRLNMDNVEHVDGDTWKFKDTQQTFRAGSGERGQNVDTFESKRWVYEQYPERFKAHRRNMAKLTGRPEWTISINELVDRGKVQAAQTKQRMEELGSQGFLDFRVTGKAADGVRDVTELIDNRTGQSFFSEHAGREQNAAYDSKYNRNQRIKDLLSGETGEHMRGGPTRSIKDALTDQPINLAVGAGRMLNSMGQSAAVLTGTNSQAVDEFFSNNRKRIDKFKNKNVSGAQLRRERLAQKNSARAADLYGVRKQEYMDNGLSEKDASIKAGVNEFKDSVKGLIQNPGRILDATIESLPYMIGVAGAGRAAISSAIKSTEKQIFNKLTARGLKEGAKPKARAITDRYFRTKAGKDTLKKVATRTGMGLVGILEGFTTGADVYDSINGMSEEEAMQSERYQALRFDQGLSHAAAVKKMAEEAFLPTVGSVIPMAMLAGKLSGATGFEAGLFTSRLGSKTIKDAITKGAKDTIIKGGKPVITKTAGKARRTAAAVGGAAGRAAKPGLQETVEESIQSGGGTFLSQLHEFEATGKEIGPGVGAATAEGAVTGFFSGAGAHVATSGFKNVGRGIANANRDKRFEKVKNLSIFKSELPQTKAGKTDWKEGDIAAGPDGNKKLTAKEAAYMNAAASNTTGSDNVPGGSRNEAYENVKKQKEAGTYNAVTDFDEALETIKPSDGTATSLNATTFKRLEAAYNELQTTDPEYAKKVTDAFLEIRQPYVAAIDTQATAIIEKGADALTSKDVQILNESLRLGTPATESIRTNEDIPESTRRVLGHAEDATGSADDAIKQNIDNAELVAEVTGKSDDEVRRVAIEKLEDVTDANGNLGLKGHIRVIGEAIINNDRKEAQRLYRVLKTRFLRSQIDKLKATEEAVKNHADFGDIKYVQGKTEQYLELQKRELKLMTNAMESVAAQAKEQFKTKGDATTTSEEGDAEAGFDTPPGTEGTDITVAQQTALRKIYTDAKNAVSTKQRKFYFERAARITADKVGPAVEQVREAFKAIKDAPLKQRKATTKTRSKSGRRKPPKRKRSTTTTQEDEDTGDLTEDNQTALDTIYNRALNATTRKQRRGYFNSAIKIWNGKTGEAVDAAKAKFEAIWDAPFRTEDGKRKRTRTTSGRRMPPKRNRGTTTEDESPISPFADVKGKELNTRAAAAKKAIKARIPDSPLAKTAVGKLSADAKRQYLLDVANALKEQRKATTEDVAPTTALNIVLDTYVAAKRIWNSLSDKALRDTGTKVIKEGTADKAEYDKQFQIMQEARREAKKLDPRLAELRTWNRTVRDLENATETVVEDTVDTTTDDYTPSYVFTYNHPGGGTTTYTVQEAVDRLAYYEDANREGNEDGTDPEADHEIQALEDFVNEVAAEETYKADTAIEKDLEVEEPDTRDSLKKAGDAARARLAAKRGNLNVGVSPQDFADLVIIAIDNLVDIGRNFLKFTKRMQDDLGDYWTNISDEDKTKIFDSALVQLDKYDASNLTPDVASQNAANAAIAGNLIDGRDAAQRLLEHVRKHGPIEGAIPLPAKGLAYYNSLIESMEQEAALRQVVTAYNDRLEQGGFTETDTNTQKPTDAQSKELTEAATTLNSKDGKGRASTNTSNRKSWVNLLADKAFETIAKGFGVATDATNAVLGLKNTLRTRGIPSKVSDVLTSKSNKTNTLLAAVPNLMDKLLHPETRYKLYDDLNLTKEEEHSLNSFIHFYRRFKANLLNIHEPLGDIPSEALKYSLGESPLSYFENDNGILDDNLLAAMALESMAWVGTSGSQTVMNTDEDINNIFGRDSWAGVSRDEQRVLRASGSVRAVVVEQLGRSIFGHMNLRPKSRKETEDYDGQFMDRLVNDIGGLSIAVLQRMGHVQLSSVPTEWYASKLADDAVDTYSPVGAVIQFVRNMPETLEGPGSLTNSAANKEMQEQFRAGKTVYKRLFNTEGGVNTPVFDVPEKAPTRVSRSLAFIPKKMQERILFMSQQAYKAENGLFGALARFDKKRFLTAAHGYIPDALVQSHVHDELRLNVESKNRGLLRDMDNALNWHNQHKDKSFYFMHKVIRSGRIYIDSSTINPQANKLHRFMFGMTAWKARVSTDPNSTSYGNFILAVGQGLGIDPGKFTRAETIKLTEEMLQTDDIVAALEILSDPAQAEITAEQMTDVFDKVLSKEGTHTLAALVAYNTYLSARDKGQKTFTVTLPIEVDGVSNGIAAGTLQTPSLNRKHLNQAKRTLRGNGLFFSKDVYQDFPTYKSDGNPDNYERTASGTGDVLQFMRDKQWDPKVKKESKSKRNHRIYTQHRAAEVTSSGLLPTMAELRNKVANSTEGRNWAKNPLMVIAYGASISSIIRTVIEDSVEKFYTNLAKADTAGEIADALNSAYAIINASNDAGRQAGISTHKAYPVYTAEMVEKIANSKYDGNIREFATQFAFKDENGKDDHRMKSFQKGIADTYGEALESTLEQMMAPYEKIRTQMNMANKAMNLIFVEDFVRRVARKEEHIGEQNNGRTRKLTRTELEEIYTEMYDEGLVPSVATALSESHREQLETTKYSREQRRGEENRGKARFNKELDLITKAYEGERATVVDNPKARKSLSTQIMEQNPNSDVGVAAVVKMIHSLDGVNNSMMFGEHPVLNMHDAVVGNLHDMHSSNGKEGIAEQGNRGFVQMHANYNLSAEIFKSFTRMMVLMSPRDNRLSEKTKNQIRGAFGAYIIKYKLSPYAVNKSIKTHGSNSIENFGVYFQDTVNKTTEARKILFGDLSSSNQFALEKSNWLIRNGAGVETDAERQNPLLGLVEPSMEQLIDAYKAEHQEQSEELTASINVTVDEMAGHLEDGEDPTSALKDFIEVNTRGSMVITAANVLDVIQQAYKKAAFAVYKDAEADPALKTALVDAAQKLIADGSRLMANMEGYTFILGQTLPGNNSEFSPDSKILKISNKLDVGMIISAVHEMYHAATYHNIVKAQKESPERFADMAKKAFEAAKSWRRLPANSAINEKKIKIGTKLWKVAQGPKKHWPTAIAEYVAYMATESTSDVTLDPLLKGREMQQLTKDLGWALTEPTTNRLRLYNTGKAIHDELFPKEHIQQTNFQTMSELFETWKEQGMVPENAEHAAFLEALIQNTLIPGIQSLEKVEHILATNPTGKEHLGEYDPAAQRVLIEVAETDVETNAHMSATETGAHEFMHAISYAAINGDHFIRKEAQRLFNQAKNAMDWTSLLPDTVVGDPDVADAIAQRYWNHIFENQNGDQLHEFIAFARSNYHFATKLSQIGNKETRKPIWSEGILQGVLNLFTRMVEWVSNKSYSSGVGSLHDGVVGLTNAIIAVNHKNLQKESERSRYAKLIEKANGGVSGAILDKILLPLAGRQRKGRNTYGSENFEGYTRESFKAQGEIFRSDMNKVYREMDGSKNSTLFQLLQEILPFNKRNLNWIAMLRKSKVLIDTLRQRIIEHTRSSMKKAFDPNVRLTRETREALSNVVLNTDLVSLMNDETTTIADLRKLVNDNNLVKQELEEAQLDLKRLLDASNATVLRGIMEAQAESLANIQVHGIPTIQGNPMWNAHTIAHQAMIDNRRKIPLKDVDKVENAIDRIATLKALQLTSPSDLQAVRDVMNHEHSREDGDGFLELLGMSMDFKQLAMDQLFNGSKVHMQKGYVYDVVDGDRSIHFAPDTAAGHAEMLEQGFTRVGPLPKAGIDKETERLAMYKGHRGLNRYSKAAMSLTDIDRAGTDLFRASELGRNNPKSNGKFSANKFHRQFSGIRQKAFDAAWETRKGVPNYNGGYLVPVLNDDMEIVNYRYIMSNKTKTEVLGKRNVIDETLPRMFASISDRNNTKIMNRKIVDLMKKEWIALRDNKEYSFVEVSKYSRNADAREMYRLMPQDTQDAMREAFSGDRFFIRDDVVNLVMGFRKLSFADNKYLGKSAPVVYIGEKVWQEALQLIKMKIVITTPAVVLANIASNMAILLSEGIPPSYIRDKSILAISAMKSYQKDIRELDELQRQIGSARALNKPIKSMIARSALLEANVKNNPVHHMVQEGMFTSIVDEFDADEGSYRKRLTTFIGDKIGKRIPENVGKGLKEAYMLPGSKMFQAALMATQYGDFVGRYVKYHYDVDVRKMDEVTAIAQSLATFVYYDIPQNRYLQLLNDNGFAWFTKWWTRTQPVIARQYSQNPVSAFGVLGIQSAMLGGPWDENIASAAFLNGAASKFSMTPWDNFGRADPLMPALYQWTLAPFIGD